MSVAASQPVALRFGTSLKPERRFHCHVYYDKNTQADAKNLLKTIQDNFKQEIAQDKLEAIDVQHAPYGPHLKPNLAIHLKESALAKLLQLLTVKSGKLLALLHPDTGNEKADHSKPFWMGVPDDTLPLDKSWFDKNA